MLTPGETDWSVGGSRIFQNSEPSPFHGTFALGSSVSEADLGHKPFEPGRLTPTSVPAQSQHDGKQHQADDESIKRNRYRQDHTHLLRGKRSREREGQEHCEHHPAADNTTRPEVLTDPVMACSGSAWVSKRSLAAESKRV